MIRTVVCKQEGCCGNKFYIESIEDYLSVTCKECGSKYNFKNSNYECKIISSCSKCNNDVFKLFRDDQEEKIYAKCCECGNPPDKIYLDSDGLQISYEEKLLQDVRDLIQQLDQDVLKLEMKVNAVESGQELLEESLAYINKYLIDKH